MDILNWLYSKISVKVKDTLNSPKDLIALGANVGYEKRGDKYQTYCMTAEDFSASVKGYKSFTALLFQEDTGAPTYTILENTLGVTVNFAYVTDGIYTMTTDLDLFSSPAEYVTIYGSSWDDGSGPVSIFATPVFFNTIEIRSLRNDTLGNDILGYFYGAPTILEIRKYI
jgi:hypothetical protein